MSTLTDRHGDTSATDPEPRPDTDATETPTPGTRRVPTLSKEAALSPGTDKRPTLPKEEIARLGDGIYQRDVRPQVEGKHQDDYVAIDLDSGSWAVSDDILTSVASLRAEQPDAVNVWLVRVGHRAVHHFKSPRLRRPA
ncbi:MAG: hypothetical protein OXL98_00635 [Acidimicrobiaceae bacterium]|nr:hypothetical protein [Acidimicrobiaceae bacterium]